MPGGLLRVLACGSVDDGKSTLLGRLCMDADQAPEDHLADASAPAHLFDGLESERALGITVDVAYRYLTTAGRRIIVADAPGHAHYTRNMVTGASVSDVAVVLADVSHGLQPQTRRHVIIASLLGIGDIILAVNKMDLVDFDQESFRALAAEFMEFAARVSTARVRVIPVAALSGDNIVYRSARMTWYDGATVLEALEAARVEASPTSAPLRLGMQGVVCDDDGQPVCLGAVLAGRVTVGDALQVLPGGGAVTVTALTDAARVVSAADVGASVGIRVDGDAELARGNLLVRHASPARVSAHAAATVIWLGQSPCRSGDTLLLKHLSTQRRVRVTTVAYRLDVDSAARVPAGELASNEIGGVWLESTVPLAWDHYGQNRETGAGVLIDPASGDTVGAVMLGEQVRPVVVWLTGLSGAGKSTIAEAAVARWKAEGVLATVLDGDRVRQGLNRDLGFQAADRRENVRRVAEVARLFADEGFVVCVPVIAPFAADRQSARHVIGEHRFVEVFVDAPLDVCEARDVKGLYRRARRGALPDFTGISSPYEAPTAPDVVLRTATATVDDCVARLLAAISLRG